MTSATERFKALLANALERVCVLESELEKAHDKIRQLTEGGNMPELEDEVRPDPVVQTDHDETPEVLPDRATQTETDDEEAADNGGA